MQPTLLMLPANYLHLCFYFSSCASAAGKHSLGKPSCLVPICGRSTWCNCETQACKFVFIHRRGPQREGIRRTICQRAGGMEWSAHIFSPRWSQVWPAYGNLYQMHQSIRWDGSSEGPLFRGFLFCFWLHTNDIYQLILQPVEMLCL